MYVPLRTFLLRAPLLPESALGDAARAFARSPLHAAAVALASPATARASDSPARRKTLDRYGRRAAFRATPQGLLAGVCLGELAATTRIATGVPTAALAPTWQQMAALGRALLDDPVVRASTRVRAAPSLGRGAHTVQWLGAGEPFGERHTVDLDAALATVLDATTGWARWTDVRARAGHAIEDARDESFVEAIDDWLLLLVDEGLLHVDVTPPLVGPPPALWMRARLQALARTDELATLDAALAALGAGDLLAGQRHLEALPAAATTPAIHGVLVQRPRSTPTLARAVVTRAAALAPLLFRLQEALVPPASERLGQPALDDVLDATTEIHGAGALALGALDAGDYGVTFDDERDATASGPSAAVLAVFIDAIVAAARARRPEATLDVAALTAAFADAGPAPPPTCELFLAPARRPRGAREGTGWLLGLHGPAGSSWGRFAAALGAPLARALDGLHRAEREARPEHESLDVSFAPSPALADLCAHPRVRPRALALTSWPDAPDARDLQLGDLELVAEPGAATPLALRVGATGAAVVPSPLSRVRSSTAPAGAPRLLVGWSLIRQHAPWALALGPLAELRHVPRIVLDGFVVAPASWRLPAAWREVRPTRAGLARWRREADVPRWIQVGHEDQLLPIDLDALDDAGAAEDLRGHDRAWEIWPPIGGAVDRDGRRVEAVVALVDRPDADEAARHARAARATAAAGRVPPPRLVAPPADWRTYKLFGAPEHADALLLDTLQPTIAAARRAHELDDWFFLRYVDGPGRRHHLRLRVRSSTPAARAAFDERLRRALEPARGAGVVVTVETSEYHAERARYGDALGAAQEIFQSDSDTACALMAEEDAEDDAAPDRTEQVVRSLDALARGLGMEPSERQALARARRDAEADADAALGETRLQTDADFRARARRLRAFLGADAASNAGGALRAHERRTARATKALAPAARVALAPALLHLACVRLAGADRALERRAYTYWERTLEGLVRSPLPPATSRGFRRTRRQAT
jgi:class I lanthipeptide synthase